MKVKIAVPYVQFDVYEITVPRDMFHADQLDFFNEMRSDGTLPQSLTYNVECLQDYNDGNGAVEPFVISDDDLSKYTRAVG